MKHAVLIHSYPGANEVVSRHWDYYKVSGGDLFGIGTNDGKCVWPEPVPFINPVDSGYTDVKCRLPQKLVQSFKWFVYDPIFSDYDTCCVIEYDSLFLSRLPDHPGGLVTKLAARCPEKWNVKSPFSLHPPWWADRKTSEQIAEFGKRMIADGECENGGPDIFLGLLVSRFNIKWSDTGNGSWSCNSLDMRVRYPEAIKAARHNDCWYIHGLKEPEQLACLIHFC